MIPPNLLPEPYQSQAFIAGGYAACPALASDMDVWICVPSPHVSEPDVNDLRVIVHLHQIRTELLKHLKANNVWSVAEESTSQSAQGSTRYLQQNHTILKVALIRRYGGIHPIHVLVTDAPNVSVLLSGFDISTHRIALMPSGMVVRGEDWTPITVPPVALKMNEHTPARMKKIAERYGHVVKS